MPAAPIINVVAAGLVRATIHCSVPSGRQNITRVDLFCFICIAFSSGSRCFLSDFDRNVLMYDGSLVFEVHDHQDEFHF